ncbi:MAG: hypothetical protein MZV63_71115 [Marinilabiliales bacterium]|nr:hypothetical protein [Marinilabiliales bacterium]
MAEKNSADYSQVCLLLTVILLGLYASFRQDKLTAALIAKLNESVNTKDLIR